MLQRAASNAYSWWWASHIRTKQSKWLEQSLQDMEEKVNETLKIIDDDGDSFAKRAEMYYRKRPELIAFVEESYKSYWALAERYDHLSKELQSANHKIATAFPEEVQFDMDDEEEEDDISRKSSSFPEKQAKDLTDGQKSRIPKVPGVPGKDFRSPASRKGQLRQIPSYAKAPVTIPTSGLSKNEALEEINKLQKEILSLQTEKEFFKIAFEKGKERYREIENQIMEMQQRVCCLQDEFSIGIVIEDNEACTLMAMTALKSCQEALIKVQGRHQQSEEEVEVEDNKIQEAYEKFKPLGGVSVPRQDGQAEQTKEKDSAGGDYQEIKSRSSEVNTVQRQKDELEFAREKMREEIDAKVSVPELAEKIDNLVDKVVNMEVEVSSQAAQVRRLRLETAVLLAHIQALEEEKENTSVESSEKMGQKLKEFEKELKRVKNLKQHVVFQCQNLLSHFTEATSNINNLSEKLENLNLDNEIEMAGVLREAKAELDGKHNEQEIGEHQDMHACDGDLREEEETKDGGLLTFQDPVRTRQEELFVISGPCSDFDALSEKPQEWVLQYKEESHGFFDAVTETTNQEFGEEGEDDQPNWRNLFLNGLEDREKILLDEYTSFFRSYKDVKKKLNDMEKKNRDGLFELAMEIRELRNANAQKEEELEGLRQKLEGTPSMTTKDENASTTTTKDSNTLPPSSTTMISGKQPLYKLLFLHNDRFPRTMGYEDGNVNLDKIGKAPVVPTVEEKLREGIDELLEENLKFWLRFSTSIHQVKKFQTKFHDFKAELAKLKDAKKQKEGNSKNGSSAPPTSEVWAIYKHLKETQTEIKLWIEHNELLNEELQNRSSALTDIQDEILRVQEVGSSVGENDLITEYEAARFQGEVMNMRQENKKIEDELREGLDHVKKLLAQIGKTLKKLDEDIGISASKKHKPNQVRSSSSSRYRIPLRSFLFGVKLKKQKPSLFTCVNPALQKQCSEMRPTELPTL